MNETPAPLTDADCDCTDLDGFMLNVERLMASELVALSSHEVVAASLFLWCRAWKQRPAASLPDDDRVNAAFAKLPLARFKKLKDQILRGFIKCSDGRLYHRVLSEEATNAYAKKQAFKRKRAADAKRLQEWRQNNKETGDETHKETPPETPSETRFVAEGQGQGQVSSEAKASGVPPSAKEKLWKEGAPAIAALAGKRPDDFRSVIGGWLKVGSTPEQILEAISKAQAEKAIDPVAYIVACLRQGPRKGDLRMVARHEARRVLETAGLAEEPDPQVVGKSAYAGWKQQRESHLRLQGIDPRSLMQ